MSIHGRKRMRATLSAGLPAGLTAGLLGGVVGGIPSTVYALLTGGVALEAVDAVASMAGAAHLPLLPRLLIAAIVHVLISLVWTAALVVILPGRWRAWWSGAAAGVVVAVFDLQVIAPAMFPAVATLEFWPQLADHLVWGTCVGAMLSRAGLP